MSGFRWISLFLLLLLPLTAVTGQIFLSFTVRDGEKVTLSCENVTTDQDKCNSTTWLFIGSGNTAAVELIVEGQIGEKAKSKSDRLSVTANCSLVIKKVTVEDVGRYSCRQFKSGRQRDHTQVDLSVISMTEHKNNNEVTLNCSVLTYDECRHTVKWLYKGKNLDTNTRTMQASQSTCSATLSLLTSHFIYTSNYKFLKCEVTDLYNGKVQLYNFSPQLSCEKPGVAETTTEPETTTSTTQEVRTDCSALSYIMLVMRVAELLLITVITVLLFRARGNQRPPDDNIVLNSVRRRTAKRSGPAASQERNDEDGSTVNYENLGETSTYVRFH
ncbi:uncharacterized protein LOC122965561 isoform X2 [Thunnus albacares]|uniref:uncharacterized protein LOC122965561 isoform X2 n=1 Tax=Thunnus albacares TaxID=8236 RepID=UPI001CF636AA|nr:uncharacterized protein LOC122965561 isoform X2 [Thunnus albacares]